MVSKMIFNNFLIERKAGFFLHLRSKLLARHERKPFRDQGLGGQKMSRFVNVS